MNDARSVADSWRAEVVVLVEVGSGVFEPGEGAAESVGIQLRGEVNTDRYHCSTAN